MDISQIRDKFAGNDERFSADIQRLLSDAPCDSEYRACLLALAEQIHSEMQQMQAELLELAENNPHP